jgi:hypothetical protein
MNLRFMYIQIAHVILKLPRSLSYVVFVLNNSYTILVIYVYQYEAYHLNCSRSYHVYAVGPLDCYSFLCVLQLCFTYYKN